MFKLYRFFIPAIVFILPAVIFISCGKDTKQTQSNLNAPLDEETKFARTLYGENASVLLKGDLTSNGKTDALAGVVKLKVNDNMYWIEKGGVIEQNSGGWKTILNMDNKLSSTKGALISQADAKYGYIIRIYDNQKPVSFTITIANEYGKGASDEAVIKWNPKNEAYEIAIESGKSIQ